MGLSSNISKKVKEIMDTNFEVEEVNYVPDIGNTKLTFGNKGLKFEAIVLHIDMRGSTKILNNHKRSTVAKIHMAYFHTIVKIAGELGGAVRSFNGDSMLVFFPGKTVEILNKAVKAAMQMVYIISDETNGINQYLSKYSAIDFGIGLDFGTVLCTKIGIGGDSNNKGLFWAGNAVNKSVKLSDLAKTPYNICISKYAYENLNEDMIFADPKEDSPYGNLLRTNMWIRATDFTYNDIFESYYRTMYHYTVS